MKAFTLVEALVSFLIMFVIMAGVYAALTAGNSSYIDDMALMQLQQEARRGMQPLVINLRNASGIVTAVIDADSDSITFNNYSGNGIMYYRDAADAKGDGIANQIIREHPAGTRRVVAGDITRLKFNYASPVVTIDVTSGRTVRQRPLSYSLKSRVRVRNE